MAALGASAYQRTALADYFLASGGVGTEATMISTTLASVNATAMPVVPRLLYGVRFLDEDELGLLASTIMY